MRRQLGLGLRNAYGSLISPKSVFSSSFLKSNSIPFHQRSCSEYSTLSRSHLWKICSPNGNGVVSRTMIQKGLFPSPLLARRLFSNALWKGRANIPHTIRNKRFYSFNSLDRGWRSLSRRFTTDRVVLGLVMTNVAVFMLWRVQNTEFMVKNFMISVDNFKSGRLHTLITSAFSHHDTFHLMMNMIGLYFFGTSVGRTFGPEFLLKLYLTGAVAGSIFYLVYHAFIAPSLQSEKMQGILHSKVPAMGASGAVNAIMLLDIFLYPTKTIYLDFILPVPAILVGIFLVGKDVWRAMQGDTKISGSAHLGGATVAFLAWLKYRKARFGRF